MARGVADNRFMCIVNHGVPAEMIAGMEDAAKRFHDLPHDHPD